MEKNKKISRETNATKLFADDLNHVKKIVKKNRYTDKRFESHSSTIRYYVELGIQAENSSDSGANNLDRAVINSTATDALRVEVLQLNEIIENLSATVKTLSANQTDYFACSTKKLQSLEASLANNLSEVSSQLNSDSEGIVKRLDRTEKTDSAMLHNLIVLRSVFYIFLLGYQTEKIKPGKDNLNKWGKLIEVAHQQANRLSIDEIKASASEELESAMIREMAKTIFREVMSHPEPEMR